MKKNTIILIGTLYLFSCNSHSTLQQMSSKNASTNVNIHQQMDTIITNWYIPSAKVAAQIAETIWLPIYGDKIYSKQPFNVELRDSIWFVYGSLPNDMDGGVPNIEIRGRDGLIYDVWHSK